MAFKGGPLYSEEIDRAIRLVVFIATPVFVIFNLLIISEIISSNSYFGHVYATFVSAAWLLVSLYIYFIRVESTSGAVIRLALYHVFALATLVGITGFGSPFAPAATLLILASYVYFGWIAVPFSIASIIITASLSTLAQGRDNPTIVDENILSAISIIVLGTAIVWIIATQESRRRSMIKSQQRERLQNERMTAIINNLTDAIFSVDDKGAILMYNAACLDLLDTNDSLKGLTISKLFNLTNDRNEKVNLLDTLKEATRASSRDDLVHTYKDKEEVRLEITYAPIKGVFGSRRTTKNQGGYIVIMRDVTRRKSLEEERDEFISVVSHELRTPITIAEGTISNLDLLLHKTDKVDKKILTPTVKTAHDQILYLAKMINDLSTLSRAERGVADEEEVMDVKELLHNVHHRHEKEALDKGLQLNLDLGTNLGSISASRLYTEELLQNLITNAIKYTKKGSVTVICKSAKGKVRFTVKDTGIGIARNEQDKIFNKFYRSEDYRIRETGGTGLGLYVSSKLAKKLKTQVELTSRLNHGSSFSFELPILQDDPSK